LGDNVDTADAEMSIFNDGDTSGKLERFLEGQALLHQSLRLSSLKSSVATVVDFVLFEQMLWSQISLGMQNTTQKFD
jgi:hypothetical protein